MDKFIEFARDRNGTLWFMCTCCGAKHRFRPEKCPVCGSGKPVSQEVENAAAMLSGIVPKKIGE